MSQSSNRNCLLKHPPQLSTRASPKEVRWDSQTLQLKAGWAKYSMKWRICQCCWGPLTPFGVWSCILHFSYQDGVPEKSSVAIGAVRWFSLSTSHLLAVWRLSGVCFKENDEYPIQLLRMSCIQFPFELKPLSAGPRWRSVRSVARTKWHLSSFPQLIPRQECLGFAFASTGDGMLWASKCMGFLDR